jgi:hypothetical protein
LAGRAFSSVILPLAVLELTAKQLKKCPFCYSEQGGRRCGEGQDLAGAFFYLDFMPTGHYTFRLLALPEQLTIVWQEGSFLATRWEEENAVNLYHMEGGFFAEVFYDQHQDVLVRTRTFTSRKCLEDYTPYIRLSDLEK